jgi:tetratricopeptide (TPR) repeat protein
MTLGLRSLSPTKMTTKRIALIFFGVVLLAACPLTAANFASASSPDTLPAVRAAQRQFDAGNYSAAVDTLRAAAAQNPSSAEIYYWLGRSYYELHDPDNAVANAEKSVALDPKNSVYHQWLGRAYGDKADRDRSFSLAKKVKKEFEQAVALDPSNITARRDLQQYCTDAPWIVGGNKDEALDQVNAIAAIDPIQGALARAAYDRDVLKKPDLAEAEYRKVLAAKPKDPDAYFEIADFYLSQAKPSDLQALIQAAAQLDPSQARLSYYRGVAGVLAGTDLASAEQNLKAYIAAPDRSDWPSHASARLWLGKLYEMQGKPSAAAEQYRAALQLDPKLKEASERLQKLGKNSQ